jgi:perosamine synthetase
MIPIYTPDTEQYTSSAIKALQSGWVSSQGSFILKTSEKLQEILDSKYVVLTNNGTSATHMLYRALKYKHPNLKKIYVPNNVFVAVWNCAVLEYPPEMLHVLEMNPETLNMREDEEYIATLEKNSAVVVVHNVGNVVNVPRLQRLRPDLIFVEDNCEAFLETYENQKTGTASMCAAISFFANKLVTAGEGGAFYTDDKELFDYIYKSCHHGMSFKRYVYDVLGFNYRMTNIQAALLYDQLCDIDTIIHKKDVVMKRYKDILGTNMVSTGRWMCVARFENIDNYEDFCKHLLMKGIDTRPMFYDISKQTHLNIENIDPSDVRHEQLCMLPSSPSLTQSEQTFIMSTIREYMYPSIVPATNDTVEQFKKNEMPSTFRYFQKHDTTHHTKTLIALDRNKVPVGYGHIDVEDDVNWLGVCVLPSAQNMGLGTRIVQELLKNQHDVKLSVDKHNTVAQNLYKKFGFVTVAETDKVYFMFRH